LRLRTLVVLGLVFAGLGFLYFKRSEELEQTDRLNPVRHPLFVGFVPNRVASIRIDNLERGVQIKLERDKAGSWFMTDPIGYPAIGELVRLLLRTFSNALGEVAPRVELDEVSLDPPLIVIEIVQAEEESGSQRSYRLEVGAVDLDPAKIFVRVADHPVGRGVFRAPRTIYNTLDRNPDDFRDRRVTHLRAAEVTSFRRRGRAFVEDLGVEVDLDFDALLEPDGWKRVDPPVVSLDPVALQLLCRGSAEMKALYFVDDQPTSMADYGLDPARFTIELLDIRGESTRLHFGYPEVLGPGIVGTDEWFCRREGFAHVFEVDARDVGLLLRPPEMLYDYLLLRALRKDIRRVELQGEGRTLVLERPASGGREDDDWTVGEAGAELRYPVDPGAVEDLLALLEGTQLGDYPEGVAFDAEEPARSLTILTRDGVRWGGSVGKPWRDAASGSPGRLYRRYGDDLVGWVEEAVSDLCVLTPEALRSRSIHKIDVFRDDVRWIKVRSGGHELPYLRLNDTDWISGENQVAAPRVFEECLDSLLNIRAEEWLDGPPGELTDKVEVEVSCAQGKGALFVLGRDAAGRDICLQDGLAAVIDAGIEAYPDRDLIESLLSLFGE